MIFKLLVTRRFAPLFWSQFFSAFNENLVRNMLAMIILFKVGAEQAGPLVTLALAAFIAPSLVLSGLGGQLADGHDKARVARWLKLAEMGVQVLAALGYWFNSIAALYAALFLLGLIATLYTPIKYGILPDHLRREELTAGNALVEGAGFVAILLGLAAGGLTGLEGVSRELVTAELVVVAVLCLASTWFIPAAPSRVPGLHIDRNLVGSTFSLIGDLRRDRRMWVGGLGSGWFWLSGSVALVLVPVIVKQRIGAGVEVETAISLFFAIGVGVGALLAGWLARGRIVLKHAPYAVAAMGLFLLDAGWATATAPEPTGRLSLSAFLHSGIGLRLVFDLMGLACAGGLFSVPVFSAVQSWAAPERRARVVAGVGVLNAVMMIVGAGVTAVFQLPGIAVPNPILLLALGAVNLGAAVYFGRNLPDAAAAAAAYIPVDAAVRAGE
ncbi:MFS transporter [Lichenibacterium dinghuense]|uniref:MFS transporter n=1 Tax=Lichenibacterium dinghuense TaxID=2895977 RepID=UPI001F023431|nr:MFS transporter [Lichenibacterium sp. 6Y81]